MDNKYPISQMTHSKAGFKPLKHKGDKRGFSDLEYFLALGKVISEEGEEWSKQHPYLEFHKEGIDAKTQEFAQIIYKGYKDGIPKKELEEYIKRSIDLNS